MPTEITQCNERVAEVRLTCDYCGNLIGTRLMLRKEAEELKNKKQTCSQCIKKK